MDAETRAKRRLVGEPVPHDSAVLHVSGRAHYTDDLPEPRGLLQVAIGYSARPHASLRAIDLSAVQAAPGVVAVLTAAEVPGTNNYGAMLADDPIFAADRVFYVGQPVFAVAAETVRAARKAARLAKIDYDDEPALLDPREALAAESFVLPSETIERGNPDAALAAAPYRLSGSLSVGGQDQFYLEGQIAMAVPGEAGTMKIYSSTQYPGEVQHKVAHALGRTAKDIVVECRRMGGGFGGKETQPALIACIAALVAEHTGRPAKLRLDRDTDMIVTGKRHDFSYRYDVGFDKQGLIRALDIELVSRCGMSADLSGPVNDRAMFHVDNAYFLSDVRVVSHRCKTHTVSNTAFRGFGGPQGMFAIECIIDEIARHLDKDPLEVRRVNFYRKGRDTTHYRQKVRDNIAPAIVEQLEQTSDYHARRADIRTCNANHAYLKRGIALTPVKFGISFTATHLNQAGALVHVYTDGTVWLNHGGTEMGQGLYIKVAQVVADELQVDLARIRITAADTSQVPNASATAASAGSDLNGMAARQAARKIRKRLTKFAAQYFGVGKNKVRFAHDRVFVGDEHELGFEELVQLAYMARTSLSATGFYRTPKIHYDRKTFTGRPFYYFAYGAAVSEVVIDVLTGEHRLLRVDILHDCGESLNPAVDLGQIEGGFIQGYGWLTSEELWWNDAGELKTHAPSTYKIPTCSDLPPDFRVEMLDSVPNRERTIYRSKAVGEPPLMLALSGFQALRDAIASVSGYRLSPRLRAPATPEAVLDAVVDIRRRDPEGRA